MSGELRKRRSQPSPAATVTPAGAARVGATRAPASQEAMPAATTGGHPPGQAADPGGQLGGSPALVLGLGGGAGAADAGPDPHCHRRRPTGSDDVVLVLVLIVVEVGEQADLAALLAHLDHDQDQD